MAVTAEAAKLRAQGAKLVDFGAGEPHFATPRHIKDAAIEAINANFTRYTVVSGIPELRKAIVERHACDFGSDYTPDEAVFTTGGKLALFNAIQVLVDHGDEVILPVPYWVSFKDIIQYAGGKVVFLETEEAENFRITADAIEKAITPRTKAIILNSPSNPAGSVVSPADLERIVRLAHERGIYLLLDECYVYLQYTGALVSGGSFTDCKEHVIVLGSLSKTYAMTGWRAGYALGPKPIIAAMSKLQSQSTSSTASFVQKAAIAALNGPQDCVEQYRATYKRRRDVMVESFAQAGWPIESPKASMFAWTPVPEKFRHLGSLEFSKLLIEKAEVAVAPGVGFGEHGDDYVRLALVENEQRIRQAARGIRRFFETADETLHNVVQLKKPA